MPCQWNEARECPLAAYMNELVEHGGKSYCPFHLPLASEKKINHQAFVTIFTDLVAQGARDFSGVAFPGNHMPLQGNPVYRTNHKLTLQKIKVGRAATIALENVSGDLSGAIFYPTSVLQSGGGAGEIVVCDGSTMRGRFTFNGTSQATDVSFDGSNFRGRTLFNGVSNLTSLSFIECTFSGAPKFGSEGLPQNTRFRGASFVARPKDEHAYRTIRLHFSKNQDRDSEGKFYALEKRCQRLGLPFGVTRLVSFLYDKVSEYGYSYERPLYWFCTVQAVCFLCYAALSDRLALGGSYDGRVAELTFAQVVKPFELFSGKAPTEGLYQIVVADRGIWLILTATQSIASFALLALFLLALRWRFKRE